MSKEAKTYIDINGFIVNIFNNPQLSSHRCVVCNKCMTYTGTKQLPDKPSSKMLIFNHKCSGSRFGMGRKTYQARLENGDFMWNYAYKLTYGFNIGGRHLMR